jgi:glycosyltransferase involved in cell wall biosynthesis
MKSVAVLVPCYKRPEYTKLCLEAIKLAQDYGSRVYFYIVDDGSNDGTREIIEQSGISAHFVFQENKGLRKVIIDFISWVKDLDKEFGIDYISKVDSDCIVSKNWMNDLLSILETSNADIISPNVTPSNAAFKHGDLSRKEGDFIPSEIVGGVWTMKKNMIDGIYFEQVDVSGITGAFHILNQIVIEKDPKIGWTDKVTFEDIGHWSGHHPLHIKSIEHAVYSAEVGRPIAWNPEVKNA